MRTSYGFTAVSIQLFHNARVCRAEPQTIKRRSRWFDLVSNRVGMMRLILSRSPHLDALLSIATCDVLERRSLQDMESMLAWKYRSCAGCSFEALGE